MALFSLLACAPGCGSKGAVTLSARVDNPQLAVSAVASGLGTELTGAFDLFLELGQVAPESTEVTLGAFALKNAAGVVVDGLPLVGDQSFPLVIDPGKSKVVHLTIAGDQLIDSSLMTTLCSGEVWYAGTVNDTLTDGRSTTASSNPLSASCD